MTRLLLRWRAFDDEDGEGYNLIWSRPGGRCSGD
jgi:hypothetical protein